MTRFANLTRRVLLAVACFVCPALSLAQDTELEKQFAQTVRPFLTAYCVSCHGGATPEGDLDLRPYSTLASVVQDYPRWSLVLRKLQAREMPPAEGKQPPDEARRQVVEWLGAMRKNEAQKRAGDPGIVLARRLSNAEYNYTIRDLTGVDLMPAREFPVDPANTAGFDNSGESLVMSPSLLAKYLQAARMVADHMVLKQDGFAFAPHPMLVETDREKYCIQRIVDFYDRQPTDFADYFLAAWRYEHRAIFGKPAATLSEIAAELKVSAKYLAIVWDALQSRDEVGPLVKLQAMWRALPVPKSDELDVARAGCVAMRDFVVELRQLLSPTFTSPSVPGLSATSQPLMNWRLRSFATHRRDFDRKALRVEDEESPKPVAVDRGQVASGSEQEVVKNWTAALVKGRREHPELLIPADQRERFEAAIARFCSVFPDAFYIRERGRFYPVTTLDKGRLLSAGFHNVMGYFRDDTPLIELILDEQGHREFETLWEEFDLIGDYTIRTYVQYYFNQSGEIRGMGRESGTLRPSDKEVTAEPIIFGLRDQYLAKAKDPVAVQAIQDHFGRVNATIRWVERSRQEWEPHHRDGLLKFASRAYRRPLVPGEADEILGYYTALREKNGLSHEEAIRASIVGLLVSPDFCYRIDLANAGSRPSASLGTANPGKVRPLSDYALASRLSYFLWSSMPDEELLARAAAGELANPVVLAAQTRRMLHDDRARGLATEFAGNWLDFRRFEDHNAVDRERFPSFDNELRRAMFEEPIRFIANVIRADRSVLELLYGKYTFVNRDLAKHYGMPPVEGGEDGWIQIQDAAQYQRGGLIPMAVFLTQNSPGLRTSPVKRGYWVARRVLGEVIPPPPPTVPELPHDEANSELAVRDMLAKHREVKACAGCHARFDSFGLTLESYGPIGESRSKDLAGRKVDTQAKFPGGSEGTGVAGLQQYIRTHREDDFLNNLCGKLLAYALGRSHLLSDDPLIDEMRARLAQNENRFSALVETIVTSPQFLNRRIPDLHETKGE